MNTIKVRISLTAKLQSWSSVRCVVSSRMKLSVVSWTAQQQRLNRIKSSWSAALEEDDHPSEPRPYKQYCTTLSTLTKAEAILIGSRLQGDVAKTRLLIREGESWSEATGDQRRQRTEDQTTNPQTPREDQNISVWKSASLFIVRRASLISGYRLRWWPELHVPLAATLLKQLCCDSAEAINLAICVVKKLFSIQICFRRQMIKKKKIQNQLKEENKPEDVTVLMATLWDLMLFCHNSPWF